MQAEKEEKYLYDVHTHMHDDMYDTEFLSGGLGRDMRMENIIKNKIKIITIGTDKVNNQKAHDLAHKYENLFYTVGLHPHDNLKEEFLENDYEKYMIDEKCVAVGECGLDYFYLKSDREKNLIENIDREIDRQKDVFIKQIQLAKKYNKPLMIHGRPSEKNEIDNPDGVDAYEDMLFILEKYYDVSDAAEGGVKSPISKNEKANGNVHFFVGDKSVADRFMAIGFTFSFGGVITLCHDYDEVLKYIDLDHIHAETDSPYVTPKNADGKRMDKINSSEYIETIIDKIAEIKSVNKQDLIRKLENNFKRDFSI